MTQPDDKPTDDTLSKIADGLLGTSNSILYLLEKYAVDEFYIDLVEDYLLEHNVEQCELCGWWFESHELVDSDNEVVGCRDCRPAEPEGDN